MYINFQRRREPEICKHLDSHFISKAMFYQSCSVSFGSGKTFFWASHYTAMIQHSYTVVQPVLLIIPSLCESYQSPGFQCEESGYMFLYTVDSVTFYKLCIDIILSLKGQCYDIENSYTGFQVIELKNLQLLFKLFIRLFN